MIQRKLRRDNVTAYQVSFTLGGRHIGNGQYQMKCPLHDDGKPSLAVNDDDGKLRVYCHAGCNQADVFRTVIQMCADPSFQIPEPLPIKRINSEQDRVRKRSRIEDLWERSKPLSPQCPAALYLRKRNVLPASVPYVLRMSQAEQYWHEGVVLGSFPAMVARVETADGNLATVHRTFLTADGCKAPVPEVRKLMSSPEPGCTKGGAIRLFPAAETMGIAEGIETALACHRDTELPVWSAVNAGLLERIVLPPICRQVVIFADNDASRRGEIAARTLGKRLIAEGRQVKIVMPPDVGTDWADL